MTQELYNKISNNVEQYILQYLDGRDDCYFSKNEDRVIKKYINEICNEKKLKINSCTEKEIEKEIEVTKEKIIKTETKIRTRNNKHR